MGIDLKPINPSKKAPLNEDGTIKWARYNWAGWSALAEYLEQWGVDISEFSWMNDGDEISEKTCLAVADAIEAHLAEVDEDKRVFLKHNIEIWRTCGGFLQL